MSKPCPLVLIEWVDSTQPSPSWRLLEDVGTFDVVVCRSVGWLIANGATKVLAPNLGALGGKEALQVSGVITIPTKSVRRVMRLKEPA